MSELSKIQLFEGQQVRVVWDDEQEKYFFSIVDVIQVLTDQVDHRAAAKYWSVLKLRLKEEGSQVPTNCSQLKMPAPDGKMRLTDVATTEQLLRLVQSVPSKKAEPFKMWLAEAAATELSKQENPKGIQQSSKVAKRGGDVAGAARKRLEKELGHTIISDKKAIDYIHPVNELNFDSTEVEQDNNDNIV